MTYSNFITEALKATKTELTKDDMQFAYITFCGFDITVKDAVKLAIEYRTENF